MTNETEEYLEHHGILGQKWGVRRGKNYPLSAGEHSSAEASKGTKGWTKDAKAEAPKVGKFATIFKGKKKTKAEKEQEKENKRQEKAEKKENEVADKIKALNQEADYYRALSYNKRAKEEWNALNKKGESAVAKQLKQAVADSVSSAIKVAGQKAVEKAFEDPNEARYRKAQKEANYSKNILDIAKNNKDRLSLYDHSNDEYTKAQKEATYSKNLLEKAKNEASLKQYQKTETTNTSNNTASSNSNSSNNSSATNRPQYTTSTTARTPYMKSYTGTIKAATGAIKSLTKDSATSNNVEKATKTVTDVLSTPEAKKAVQTAVPYVETFFKAYADYKAEYPDE